jgi:hypothetical protein
MATPLFRLKLPALFFIAIFATGLAFAQKPPKGGGGTPPPSLPGIIYHWRNQEVWAIRPDGSELTRVLPTDSTAGAIPCFHAQGSNAIHGRWYLESRQTGVYATYRNTNGTPLTNFPHRDLFAVRTKPGDPTKTESIQLTDLYGIALIVDGGSWSIDDNESIATSFVNTKAYDLRDTFSLDENGNGYFDATGKTSYNLRLPMTASQITLGWISGGIAPYRPVDPAELTGVLWPNLNYTYAGDQQLTPNAQFIVALGRGNITLLDPVTTNPLFVIWDGSTMGTPTETSGWWNDGDADLSMDSTRIVVLNYPRTSEGGVWILPLDRSSPPLQIAQNYSKSKDYTEYDQVKWSSDSKYIIARRHSYTVRAGHTFDQVIIPATGGSPVVTFANSPMQIIRWVSSDSAP